MQWKKQKILTQKGIRTIGFRMKLSNTNELDKTKPGPKPSGEEIVWKWIERTDAQNFVVLGDSAAHIRVNNLS